MYFSINGKSICKAEFSLSLYTNSRLWLLFLSLLLLLSPPEITEIFSNSDSAIYIQI